MALFFAPNKRAPEGTAFLRRGNLAGSGSKAGRGSRKKEGRGGKENSTAGEKMVMVPIASPRFTVLQSVHATISFLLNNSLSAGYYSMLPTGNLRLREVVAAKAAPPRREVP